MIKQLPDLILEITAHEPGTIETELNTAVETVLTHAMRERSCGILVTQHGYNRYTVALSPDVPYGETRERREWDRPATASLRVAPEPLAGPLNSRQDGLPELERLGELGPMPRRQVHEFDVVDARELGHEGVA
jgi:hypothetical protein